MILRGIASVVPIAQLASLGWSPPSRENRNTRVMIQMNKHTNKIYEKMRKKMVNNNNKSDVLKIIWLLWGMECEQKGKNSSSREFVKNSKGLRMTDRKARESKAYTTVLRTFGESCRALCNVQTDRNRDRSGEVRVWGRNTLNQERAGV